MSYLIDLVPGVAHACCTISLGYPFDTVKTRIQTGLYGGTTSRGASATVATVRNCITQSAKVEGGIGFLYRGCSIPLANLLLKRPIEFAIYEKLNQDSALAQKFGYESSSYFVNGAVASSLGAIIGCPFNVVKVRIQSRPGLTLANAVREGKLFRGLWLNFSFSVPAASLYLGFYGQLREYLLVDNLTPGVAGAIAGVASSVCMWSCLMPVDAIRTRVQARGETAKTAFNIVTKESLLGMWRGLWTMYARALVITAPSMFAYETARNLVSKYKQEEPSS